MRRLIVGMTGSTGAILGVRFLEALKHAELVDPKDWVAHHELGYLYKDDGRRVEAIAQFRKYLNLRPDAGDAETVRDDIYYLQEQSRRTP